MPYPHRDPRVWNAALPIWWSRGDKVIVCQNGVFGGRMKENVERCGGTAVMVQDDWGQAVDPQKLEEALVQNPDAVLVAFVHAETSTGAQSDAKTLVELAHKHDCLAIVDAVTSLAGTPLKVDEWQIDAIYSGSQKCLSASPGLSPVSFSPRAAEKNQQASVQGAELVPRSQFGYGLLGWGGQARLSPHSAGELSLWSA